MRILAISFALTTAVTASALFAACSTSGGVDGEGTNGAGGGGGGYYGSGGGSGPDEVASPDGPDAGADADAALFTCEGLDSSKPLVLYLSSDDSNSMGSPVQARELLREGRSPSRIRTYEFLNYYRIDYAAPPAGQLALFAEAEPAANPGEFDLQLAVRSFDAVKPRRPMTITFVLDTSGSMEGAPIERERAVVKAIAKSLAPDDIVNMVTWNTANQTILDGHVVTGPNDAALIAAAESLGADGGTDLHSGLVRGYELAQLNYGSGRLNRLVLVSDGGANVGITDEELIGEMSKDADKEGIYLVGVGAGPAAQYNDLLMDTVTDRGRGAYVYLDDPLEADHMFVERFDETMEVAARGVQIELTLPWYFKIEKFYGEEYSTNPEEVEPQHLAPSDAMVLNQVLSACDPAVVADADPVKVRVTWRTPLTYEDQETTFETTVGALLAAEKPHMAKGKAIVAYAEALKAGTQEALQGALAKVQAANPSGTDPELNEIAELIAYHPAF